MFEKRLRGYRAIGYARGEAPLGYAEPREDLVPDYEDVLRIFEHDAGEEENFDRFSPARAPTGVILRPPLRLIKE
jgi:hypothetical protein